MAWRPLRTPRQPQAAGFSASLPAPHACPHSRHLACRDDFFAKVGAPAGDEAAMAQMHAFCTAFSAVLAEVQAFLADNSLDDPAKV